MKILVVGERRNSEWSPILNGLSDWRWTEETFRLPAFPDALSRSKLKSAGVDLDSGDVDVVNLLPPAPQSVKWDRARATKIARLLDTSDYDLLMLTGGRVAAAFGVCGPYGPKFGKIVDSVSDIRTVVVPHPSGLCRFWNDGTDVSRLKRKVVRLCRDLSRQ